MNSIASTNSHIGSGHGPTPRNAFGAWADRVLQRRALATLDHRMLSDIGLSPSDRDMECRKPFWQA